MDGNPGVLFFYLEWATEMHAQWAAVGRADATSQMYLLTWVGALYAVVEGWRQLKLGDSVVDRMLSMTSGQTVKPNDGPERPETYVDLLRRARNDVFHYSGLHHPKRIAAFFDAPGAQAWAQNLHGAFRFFFERRAQAAEKE